MPWARVQSLVGELISCKPCGVAKKKKVKGEETSLLCRRIPNNLCKSSSLKERQHKSPLLNCELCIITSFQRVYYEKLQEQIMNTDALLMNKQQPEYSLVEKTPIITKLVLSRNYFNITKNTSKIYYIKRL